MDVRQVAGTWAPAALVTLSVPLLVLASGASLVGASWWPLALAGTSLFVAGVSWGATVGPRASDAGGV